MASDEKNRVHVAPRPEKVPLSAPPLISVLTFPAQFHLVMSPSHRKNRISHCQKNKASPYRLQKKKKKLHPTRLQCSTAASPITGPEILVSQGWDQPSQKGLRRLKRETQGRWPLTTGKRCKRGIETLPKLFAILCFGPMA